MPETGAQNPARRSAILLLALDEDSAANVFRRLSSQDMEAISQEMAKLTEVSHDEMAAVLEAFHHESSEYATLNFHTSERIRAILTKAFGSERAESLLEDLLDANTQKSGIDALNIMDASLVSEMIRDEHPQIIATILIHLERRQAADILEQFDEKLREDIVLRIATFSGVQPAAFQELTEVLGGLLDGQNVKRSKMGGVRTTAEILNLMSSSMENAAIDAIRNHNEDLAQRIVDEMFLFENLADLDDRSIQLILNEINQASLVIALKGAPKSVVDKFLSNMSQRAADLLVEDIEATGPVRISRVDAEQKAILQVVRKLIDTGDIVISGGDDAYV